jgi:hypothetical protein
LYEILKMRNQNLSLNFLSEIQFNKIRQMLLSVRTTCLSVQKFFSESLRMIVRKTKVEIFTNLQVFTSAVQRASSGQSVKDFSNTVFARTSRGWRITVGGLVVGWDGAKFRPETNKKQPTHSQS